MNFVNKSDFTENLSSIKKKINRNSDDFPSYCNINMPPLDKYFERIKKVYEDETDPEVKEALYWVITGSATEISFLEIAMQKAVGIY